MSEPQKVALVFSGGPAPAANAVISSAALAFIDNGYEVLGILDGFSRLQKFAPDGERLVEGRDFLKLDTSISSIRNLPGIFIRSSRANPGKMVKSRADLDSEALTVRLRSVKAALDSLGVGLLVTIGGDDTLKTANFLKLLGLKVIHVPKTIDNDYYGIAWTFGFWSAIEAAKRALLNLKADADSTGAYFMVELMGRKAGWLAYASAVAGEACAVVAAEDIEDRFNPDELASRFANLIIEREKDGRRSGVICIAEGLAEKLEDRFKPKDIDEHGNVYYGHAELCKSLAEQTAALYKDRTGSRKKINPKQVGYETRCAPPVSYDVILGSALGYGAYRLHKKGLYGHMVSVRDNMELVPVPFSDLIDPETMLTKIRLVPPEGDFFRLKKALSYPVDEG